MPESQYQLDSTHFINQIIIAVKRQTLYMVMFTSIRRRGYYFSLLVFVRLLFEGGVYIFTDWKARGHKRQLDRVRTSETVKIARCAASQSCCQPWKRLVEYE